MFSWEIQNEGRNGSEFVEFNGALYFENVTYVMEKGVRHRLECQEDL